MGRYMGWSSSLFALDVAVNSGGGRSGLTPIPPGVELRNRESSSRRRMSEYVSGVGGGMEDGPDKNERLVATFPNRKINKC